jgi:hypothetical protein
MLTTWAILITLSLNSHHATERDLIAVPLIIVVFGILAVGMMSSEMANARVFKGTVMRLVRRPIEETKAQVVAVLEERDHEFTVAAMKPSMNAQGLRLDFTYYDLDAYIIVSGGPKTTILAIHPEPLMEPRMKELLDAIDGILDASH